MQAPHRRMIALLVACCALGAGAIGVTHAAFNGQTANAGNRISAAPDFRAPTITSVAVGKTAGGATGSLRPGATYYVYANVTDVGNPPSGVATVRANVSSLTAGQTALPLAAGSYTVGGQTFNYRSASRIAAAGLPAGSLSFTVTATDVAGNAATRNGSVAIDITVPTGTDVQTANKAGGIAGKAEQGDSITWTFSEPVDPESILAGWSGAATTVSARMRNGGNPFGDRLEVWNQAENATLPLGTLFFGRTDYISGTPAWFPGSIMTMSGSTVTLVLGTPSDPTDVAAGSGALTWSPSSAATDHAGNPVSTAAVNEAPPADRDF